jgi:hypothetical protein
MLFLYLDGLLVRHKRHLVFLTIVASLVLTGAFGTTSILGIGDSYTTARLAVKVDRLFVASI